MTNLTERLRYCGKELADHYSHSAIFDEAADEIERLRAWQAEQVLLIDDTKALINDLVKRSEEEARRDRLYLLCVATLTVSVIVALFI